MATILVVDDEPRACQVLDMELSEEGYDVKIAYSATEALEIFKKTTIDLMLIDIYMKPMSGLELLKIIKGISFSTIVIMMTAYGSIEGAVEAMKLGAFHYISKPLNLESLKSIIKKALEMRRLILENIYLKEELQSRENEFNKIIGKSPVMQQLFELIKRVAPTKTTVTIFGESGTGKELIARAIHEHSPRCDKPFVVVNCVAIPETLLESELFGHVKGAFTDAITTKPGKFELADGGTIFLDEIGDMSLALQGKILRVLQEREIEPVGGTVAKKVDVRIIAATNRSLPDLVKQGKFREDLYFRLNVVPIIVPPLRERKEDIPYLAQYFLSKYSKEAGKKIDGITPNALELLQNYNYPGNVRELENLIERAVVLCTKNYLDVEDFLLDAYFISARNITSNFREVREDEFEIKISKEEVVNSSYRKLKAKVIKQFDYFFFDNILKETAGNITLAANRVKMHRKNLSEKLKSLGINPNDYQKNNHQ